ncbi:MAG: hypothetical protein LQ349_000925 [Xanthoria aureola]|nr:MAG: hypothetical protein LQ349_000925 [Xanthoria aureola]
MEPNDSPQHQRAHRIADDEWELWRGELVRLYMEGAELKEIPKVMAEEHQFFTTTAQLKDQFRKWHVNKYFTKQELAWMASETRKRGGLGKRARFQHHGHEVEEERLERALKRQRSRLYTPESPPKSLKLVPTPTRSPQLALIAPATQTSLITAPQLGDRTNTHPTLPLPYDSHLPRLDHASLEDNAGNDLRAGRDAMELLSLSEGFALETSPDYFSNYQIPLVSNGVEQMLGSPLAEGRNFIHSRAGSAQILGSPLAEGGNFRLSRAGSAQILGSPLAEGVNFTLSRASPAQSPESDWRTFINFPPTTRSRSRTFGSLVSSPRLAQPGNPPSHQPFEPFSGAPSSGVLSVQSSENNIRMSSYDHDPEKVLLNLQLMKTSLAKILRSASDTSVLHGCNFRRLKSQWLQNQLEDLTYEACTSTLATIQRRRLAREGPLSPAVLGRGITTLRSFSDYFRMDVNCLARVHSPHGLLIIQHGTAPPSSSNNNVFAARPTIMLTYVPNDATIQTEGLQVVFFHPAQDQGELQISPSIRTFNVVSKHAEIITCVKMNDVQGIRSLFDARKASARDVDESGYSLLSYAVQSGGEDVFKLLLLGGADTQNTNL